MKRFLAYALVMAFGLIASPISAGEFPDGQSYRSMSGNLLDPAAQNQYTTLDSVGFGFQARAVRICLVTESQTIYIRRTATATNVTASLDTNRAPSSTSAAFIDGVSGTDQAYPAMVMTSTISSGGGAAASAFPNPPRCTTIPLEARGITIHVVSGLATAEVTGFK